MQIPLDFWNISLWLAVTAIILLITAQLVSEYEGEASMLVDEKRLRNAALIMSVLFPVTFALRIFEIITSL